MSEVFDVVVKSIHKEGERTIVTLTSSHLNELSLCFQRYDYWENDLLRPLRRNQAFAKGTVLHKMMEIYYNSLIARREKKTEIARGDMIELAILEGRREAVKEEVDGEDFEIIRNSFKENVNYWWGKDGWIPLAAEVPFSKILFESSTLLVLYEGKIDLLIEHEGKQKVVDHKSESRKSEPIPFNNQFTGYSWAAELPDLIVNKVGFQSSKKIEEKHRHIPFQYSEFKIQEWIKDTMYYVNSLLACTEHDYWPRNRTGCEKFGSRCPYLKLCDAPSEKDRLITLKTDFMIGERHDHFAEED